MDLGIGGGLRIRLSQALAVNDTDKAKTLISSAYYSLLFIVAIVFIVYCIVRPFINWDKVFNAPINMRQELDRLMLYVFCFYSEICAATD